METVARVVRIDKFTSKKGNPCANVWVDELGVPYRILVFEGVKVADLPAIGEEVIVRTDIAMDMSGRLTIDRQL